MAHGVADGDGPRPLWRTSDRRLVVTPSCGKAAGGLAAGIGALAALPAEVKTEHTTYHVLHPRPHPRQAAAHLPSSTMKTGAAKGKKEPLNLSLTIPTKWFKFSTPAPEGGQSNTALARRSLHARRSPVYGDPVVFRRYVTCRRCRRRRWPCRSAHRRRHRRSCPRSYIHRA